MSRREMLKSVASMGAVAALMAPSGCITAKVRVEEPLEVGLTKQLLVDDWVITETQNLTRSLGRVVKANGGKPLQFTRSAEAGSDTKVDVWPLFASVYFEPAGKRFRMWHRVSFNDSSRRKGAAATVDEIGVGARYVRGYSESTDGIHFKFVAPLEGLTTSGDTNLVVTIDEHESDPAHRYKIGYDCDDPVHAAALAHSADGIHWTPYNRGKPVTYRASDFTNQILWEPSKRAYRLFTRTDFGGGGGGPLAGKVDVAIAKEKLEVRGVRSMLNHNFKAEPTDWKLEQHFLLDGEEQITSDRPPITEMLKDPQYLKRVRQEALRRQIYVMTDSIYQGVHFGLMAVLEYPTDVSEGVETDHVTRHERSVENYYFATSRDGVHWNFHWVYAGQPLVPRGGAGAWDKDMIFPTSQIVTHDDRHWIYYGGNNERHGAAEKNVWFVRQGGIGLAHLRLDGFVALEAGKEQGYVVTKPFKLDGKQLELNVDASGRGRVRVEMLDAAGSPIAKFSGKNAADYQGVDKIRHPPAWKGRADLSDLVGQIVRLRIHLTNARLYAFQVRP